MNKTYILLIIFIILINIFLVNQSDINNCNLDLNKKYYEAVKDAIVAEPNEIYDNLIDINESNNYLTWNKDKTHLLVTTWTSKIDRYQEYSPITTKWGITWVTVVPEIKDFYKKNKLNRLNEQELELRIKQVLGLPPNYSNCKFVEMWVRPSDLFRPSPDNEINDKVAQLDFPVTVEKDYKNWFNENILFSYYSSTPYPWTRLGYTYDWGSSNSKIGLSEFCIKQNSLIYVKKIYSTKEYFCN